MNFELSFVVIARTTKLTLWYKSRASCGFRTLFRRQQIEEQQHFSDTRALSPWYEYLIFLTSALFLVNNCLCHNLKDQGVSLFAIHSFLLAFKLFIVVSCLKNKVFIFIAMNIPYP